jgi:YHS domain-containing protein
MVKDPVCGMMVDERTAKFKSQHRGKTRDRKQVLLVYP